MREHNENPLTRWGISIVLACVVGVSMFFLKDSYASAQARLKEHQDRLTSLEMRMTAAEEARKNVQESLTRLEQTDIRVERKIDRILEHQTRGIR